MKASTIQLSFLALVLLTACSSNDNNQQLIAESSPSSENTSPVPRADKELEFNVQDYIKDSQQQAENNIGLPFNGKYKSKLTTGFTTTLQLNPDHTTVTRYDYENGDRSLIESGYWQKINKNQLNVLITQHDDKPIIAIRLYTIDGTQLSAHKEIINGNSYELGSNGLILEKVN